MASYGDKISCLQNSVATSPEYADILPFFIELFRYLDQRGGANGITILLPETGAKVRSADGFPLISPDAVRVDRLACVAFLVGAIELLKRIGHQGRDELGGIEAALRDGRLDPAALFRGIMERQRTVVDEAADAVGVPAPLLEYVFEIPLKAALEQFAATVAPGAVSGWQESYCPVCGSRAGMAEFAGDEGKRYLCCSTCTFRWPFKRLRCPFCGNEETKKLSYFVAGAGATRVDTCRACSRYIKTRDSRDGGGDIPLDLEDMLTIHLDLLAARAGFERGK